MKRGIIIILLISILLISPLIQAQTQAQAYSGFNKFTDNIKLFFSSGDKKVMFALEIREKEIDSAISNSQNQNEKDAIKNLEKAHEKLQIVREEISLDVADEIKESVDEVVNKIEDEENLSDNFDVYVLEEKRTQLMAELTKETFELCKELAEEDFVSMLQEERCNPETAPDSLKKELKELKQIQEELFVQLMLEIRSCVGDPGTCNCEANLDVEQKEKCEKMVALAVKCEYKDDENACVELESMKPVKGDDFAESFVPGFLKSLFKEKSYMVEYNIEKSDVPPECYNENDKPECEQYAHMKETRSKCWDKKGNFNYDKCGGSEDKEPTMQESIPQCYDENDNFLEEKCGKITIVENEDGLINYLIENELNNVIDEFENKSEQHTIDTNISLVQTNVLEVEEGIRTVEEDIQGWVVDHSSMDVDSDNGLTWDIKTDVAKEVSGKNSKGDNNVVDNTLINDGGDNGDSGNDVDEDENPSESGTVGDIDED